MMKLSVELEKWRTDRPDEWKMDEFVSNAVNLETERDALAAQVEALRKALAALSVQAESALQEDIVCHSALMRAQREADEVLDTTPQQHLAELRAAAAKAALLKLADEYRPFGLRHSYTAFDVANHVSAQAEYYADSIRRGEVK